MEILKIFAKFIFACLVVSQSYASELVDGTYIGWKELESFNSSGSDEIWYHQSKLTISDNRVTISESPCYVKNGTLLWSQSDGGFFYHKGVMQKKNYKTEILIEISTCDYCSRGGEGWNDHVVYPVYIENEMSFKFRSIKYVLMEAYYPQDR